MASIAQASPTHFDLVILGAGPGGYVAAIRAAQLGKSVAIVEQQYWGGVCLNIGCVPAKSLLRNAEVAHLVTHEAADYGISGDTSVDYRAAYERSRTISQGRTKGVRYLMRKNGVAEFAGRGIFVDSQTMEVTLEDGTAERLSFDSAIVGTGATPRLLPGVSLSENVVTYETLILEKTLPSSIIIVGGGAIGIEFAYLMRCYGVDVTVVEYSDRILPNEDAEVSKELEKQLGSVGVRIVTSARVNGANDAGDSVTLTYTDTGETPVELTAEKMLMAVGFEPAVEGYGLESAGIELNEHGAIAIDEFMRTSTPGIYAIGDVTAKFQLAHVAEAQGIVAAEHLATGQAEPIRDYRMMPRVTFSQPQVASFGFTERQARDAGHEVTVSTFPFLANAKAHTRGDATGFVKLVADAEYGELLGGHMIGHDVSELLPELTMAQKFELTSHDIILNVHTHPTMSEAIREAAHGLIGPMINL